MTPIIDLHQDLYLYVSKPHLYPNDKRKQTSFEQLKKNMVKVAIVSVFPDPDDGNYLSPHTNTLMESDLQSYVDYTKEHPEFRIIRTKNDLDEVMETPDVFGLILHVEGFNAFDDALDWPMLERWYKLGLRSIGPVWNLSNPFGGGTVEEGDLTSLGRKLIKWCLEKGVILDCAHMNEQTFWSTVELLGTKPVFISHGNAFSICNDVRNYTDKQLQKVRETNGCIGVFFSKKFLGSSSKEIVHAHLNKLVEVAGPNSVGIGSDFGGIFSGFADTFDSLDSLPGLIESLPEQIKEPVAYKNALRILRAYLT